jgi:putative transposase
MKNTPIYAGYRYPSQIISHAVWLYHRFTLSLCDIEELLVARGITISYETLRNGCHKFGQRYCKLLKKNRGRLGDTWYLDQKRKDKKAARRFFRKLLKGQQALPIKIVTDKLRSYSAAKKELIPDVEHSTKQYENNRCELSHQPSRQQEKQMSKFKSQGQPQRFLFCHGVVNNLFRLGRHLMSAKNYRFFRERAFNEWSQASSIQH